MRSAVLATTLLGLLTISTSAHALQDDVLVPMDGSPRLFEGSPEEGVSALTAAVGRGRGHLSPVGRLPCMARHGGR